MTRSRASLSRHAPASSAAPLLLACAILATAACAETEGDDPFPADPHPVEVTIDDGTEHLGRVLVYYQSDEPVATFSLLTDPTVSGILSFRLQFTFRDRAAFASWIDGSLDLAETPDFDPASGITYADANGEEVYRQFSSVRVLSAVDQAIVFEGAFADGITFRGEGTLGVPACDGGPATATAECRAVACELGLQALIGTALTCP